MKLFLLLLSFHLAAETVSVKDFKLNNNVGWEAKQNIFSLPLILFSPRQNGQASNLSLSGTQIEGEIDYDRMRADEKGYKEIKLKFLQKINGELISLIPYEVKVSKNNHRIHSQGMSFMFKNKVYVEKSYFIDCRQKHYYGKSLRLKINENHDEQIDTLLDEFDCGEI